jgi:hypothetical protein
MSLMRLLSIEKLHQTEFHPLKKVLPMAYPYGSVIKTSTSVMLAE